MIRYIRHSSFCRLLLAGVTCPCLVELRGSCDPRPCRRQHLWPRLCGTGVALLDLQVSAR
jgi:hypothetical protein